MCCCFNPKKYKTSQYLFFFKHIMLKYDQNCPHQNKCGRTEHLVFHTEVLGNVSYLSS